MAARSRGKVSFDGTAYDYRYVVGKKNVRAFLANPFVTGQRVCIDIETYARNKFRGDDDAGLLPVKSKIRLLQAFDGDTCVVLDLMDTDGSYLLTDLDIWFDLYSWLHTKTLIAHNALFETAHLQNVELAHHGFFTPLNIRCTMMMYRLCVSARTPYTHNYPAGLAPMLKKLYDFEMPKEEQMSDWSKQKLTDSQVEYAALDAVAPYYAASVLVPLMDDYGLLDVFMLNVEAQEALTMMKLHGVTVDKDKHSRLWGSWGEERGKYELECLLLLNDHVGTWLIEELWERLLGKVVKRFKEPMLDIIQTYIDDGVFKDMTVFFKLQNYLIAQEESEEDHGGRRRALRRVIKNIKELLVSPDSGKQVSVWLKENLDDDVIADWPTTASGKDLKTDSEAFGDHDYIPATVPIGKYKKYAKLDGTYGAGMSKFFVDVGDRTVIHSNLSLCFTSTGRMSSYSPNLQNIPRDKELRSIFIPSGKDRSLVVCDYSQVELRIAAELSQDETLLTAYRNGLDIHSVTAASMACVPMDKVTKEQRQAAKAANFSLLYGGGAATLRRYAKQAFKILMTEEESEETVDAFRATYPEYRDWQLSQSRAAEHNCYVTTAVGKHRALFEDNTYTVSMNHPVQGSAAEVMLRAMIRITNDLMDEGYDAFMVMVVHDEVIIDCLTKETEEIKELVEECMVDGFLDVFPDACTNGLVDANAGRNWDEAK